MGTALPPIPVKRYFTIGEVGDLCGVKPHVLRYWEQEFTQLRPMKRRGNRRYYQHHEVLMIRRIRDLLYEQGFTISGARNKLQENMQIAREERLADGSLLNGAQVTDDAEQDWSAVGEPQQAPVDNEASDASLNLEQVRRELFAIRLLLSDIA
jgi:DNA-binding transcriptional MerR regulator